MHVSQHAAGNFKLASWRSVCQVIDGSVDANQPFSELRAVRREAGEHEAAIATYAGDTAHTGLRVVTVKTRAVVTLFEGDRLQRAIRVIAPAMIAAAELLDVATGVTDQHGTLVRATVVENFNLIVCVPDHDHGLTADNGRIVITRIGHLAVVTNVDPGMLEDAFHL